MVNFSVAWGSLHHRLDDLWIEMEGGRVDHDSVRDALARIREHELYVDRDTTVEPQRTRLLLESSRSGGISGLVSSARKGSVRAGGPAMPRPIKPPPAPKPKPPERPKK